MRPSSGVKDLGLYLLLSKNRCAEHRASARTPLARKKQRQWKKKARDVIPSAGLSGLVICVGCALFHRAIERKRPANHIWLAAAG